MWAVRTNVGIRAEVIQNPRMYYSWTNNKLSPLPLSFSVLTTCFTLLSSRLRKQIRQRKLQQHFLNQLLERLFCILQGHPVKDDEAVYVTVVNYSITQCGLVSYVVKM